MKTKPPVISILMPARNAGEFIRQAIASVREQDFDAWELIVVDDRSDDDLWKISEEFQADPRMRFYVNSLEAGIIPALDLAFRFSRGAYITRMDADDLMPPGKLSSLFELVKQHPKTVATGKVQYFSDQRVSEGYNRYEGWLNSLVDSGTFYPEIYRECILASPNWMVSRRCFEQDFKFNELRYPEDYDMVFRWYQAGYSIRAATAVTHLWREHPNRTSRTSDVYQQASFFRLKTAWFIKLELKDAEKIQLLGAGRKGKLVAKKLMEENVAFDWFDFNAAPDQVVMSKKISSVSLIRKDLKTILTAWPVDPVIRQEIQSFMTERDFVAGKNYWLF
jgi:glycosyltransferase involved in cell wall biosynthesis